MNSDVIVKGLQILMFCGLTVFFYEFGARENDISMLPCLVGAWGITAVFWIPLGWLQLWLLGRRARRSKLPRPIERAHPRRLPEISAGEGRSHQLISDEGLQIGRHCTPS